MNLFGEIIEPKTMSLSSKNGLNDYFLFNDLRNGHSTIHSWDIIKTTPRQKEICLKLLRNRRKSLYGKLDGNPLSLKHFQSLDSTINPSELDELVKLEILKPEEYKFLVKKFVTDYLSEEELEILSKCFKPEFTIDELKVERSLKLKKFPLNKIIEFLKEKNILECIEIRYDFKNTKISTGLFGVNRVFLPTSNIFPTLVASDTNDYITLKAINETNHDNYKKKFLEEIYKNNEFRKITKPEACLIQGFQNSFR